MNVRFPDSKLLEKGRDGHTVVRPSFQICEERVVDREGVESLERRGYLYSSRNRAGDIDDVVSHFRFHRLLSSQILALYSIASLSSWQRVFPFRC
jgi:hypothetical protein